MERSITEELAEVLKKKKVDFLTLSAVVESLPKALREQLGLTAKYDSTKTKKALSQHLGNELMIKRGRSLFLTFKQPDEMLLFRILQKSPGKKASANGLPFTKGEYTTLLNKIIDQGLVNVKIGQDSKGNFVPLLLAVEAAPKAKVFVSEEALHSAFKELERGEVFVDIYALRRRLNWPREEFDAMLRTLRDAGTIQLHAGDATTMSPDEIVDGFVDENGYRLGTITWQ